MVCVLGRRMSPSGTVRMNNMVNRGMRFISPVVLMGLAGFMCAEVASQSPQAVFKPDYQSRCPCDHSIAETLLAYPQCSLCLESEFHPPHVPFFFIQDNNPTKPNRWLILPRAHDKGMQNLSDLPADVSREFWAAAIRKAEELWGKQWGLAVNGELAPPPAANAMRTCISANCLTESKGTNSFSKPVCPGFPARRPSR